MANTINIENNKFTFNNQDISIIFDGDKKPWFSGNGIGKILGYAKPGKAVNDHVDEKYKTTYSDLKEFDLSKEKVRPDSVYIDEVGVCHLLCRSKNKMCEFTSWMFENLLPTVRKYHYGVFHLKEENEKLRILADDYYYDDLLIDGD